MNLAPMNGGVLLSSYLGHKGRAAHSELTRNGLEGLCVGEAVNKTPRFIGAKTNRGGRKK